MNTSNSHNRCESLLTEDQAAQVLGFTSRTLQTRRVRGGGPVYIKVSRRAVRYRASDLQIWVGEKVRNSTSQNPKLIIDD